LRGDFLREHRVRVTGEEDGIEKHGGHPFRTKTR
jgi:hypothetical protein